MKISIAVLCFLLISAHGSFAQTNRMVAKVLKKYKTNLTGKYYNAEQEIIDLSKNKWLWMAEKRADTLAALFHENSMFVHMGGSGERTRK